MVAFWLIFGVYGVIILVTSFIANIPTMLGCTFALIVGIGIVFFVTNAFGTFLVLLPTYLVPALIIAVIAGLIVSGFNPEKAFKSIISVILIEIAFYMVWTNVPTTPYDADNVTSIEISSNDITTTINEEKEISSLINIIEETEYTHAFEQWIDNSNRYTVKFHSTEEKDSQTIILYGSEYIGIEKDDKIKYYKAKEEYDISAFSKYITEIEAEIEYQEMMNQFGNQLNSLKESIHLKNGILSFTIPSDMPSRWSAQVFATEAKGSSYIKRDFLTDVEWKENTTYNMEIESDVFTSLRLKLKLDSYITYIDFLDYLPESQIYKK